MCSDFSYKKKNEFYIIQKHTFPSFEATFDLSKEVPQLVNIKFSDVCSGIEMMKALSEMDLYLKSIDKETGEEGT